MLYVKLLAKCRKWLGKFVSEKARESQGTCLQVFGWKPVQWYWCPNVTYLNWLIVAAVNMPSNYAHLSEVK